MVMNSYKTAIQIKGIFMNVEIVHNRYLDIYVEHHSLAYY